MLLIECPWCGRRSENEFRWGGQAHVARPADPQAVTDDEWADYMFYRENPSGFHHERWLHRFGCGRWFNLVRHTRSHEIASVYRITDPIPSLTAGGDR